MANRYKLVTGTLTMTGTAMPLIAASTTTPFSQSIIIQADPGNSTNDISVGDSSAQNIKIVASQSLELTGPVEGDNELQLKLSDLYVNGAAGAVVNFAYWVQTNSP